MLQPLATLRQIMQDVAKSDSPSAILDLIVQRVKHAMNVDACSIYICTDGCSITLTATEGLDRQAIGKVRMNFNEGLAGTIAANQSLLNIESASSDPRFVYFPETHEEIFEGFLGVPVIHLRQVVGVLIVQGRARRRFSEDEEAFLITLSAQLASNLNSLIRRDLQNTTTKRKKKHQRIAGIKGSAGVAIGRVLTLKGEHRLENIENRSVKDVGSEILLLRQSIAATSDDLKAGESNIGASLPADVSALFSVYLMMLESPDFALAIEQRIRQQQIWAPAALRDEVAERAALFEQVEDPYLRARGEDVRHIGNRLLQNLLNKETPIAQIDAPVILAAPLISIADIAQFPQEYIAGIVCSEGSALSHTSVLANALGIPAVMGLESLDFEKLDNTTLIVDGFRGVIFAYPPSRLVAEYRILVDQEKNLIKGLEKLRHLPAETPDGKQINLQTNTGLLADISPGLERGSEGIGLYRSEIPFMMHESFPTEEEQLRVYRHVLEMYKDKPVAMRTLDIGGDKGLPYFKFSEENPYLGWRGIRFTLDNSQILLTQIRAMLRADIGLGNLRLLIPMVSRVDEVDSVIRIIDQAIAQLSNEEHTVRRPELGVMIEVPAAIFLISALAKKIDFISVGSNDLTQYMLAVDRNNAKVSNLFNSLHPSVLNAIKQIVKAGHAHNLPVSICGEMGSDPVAVLLLLAMNVDTLSMSAYNLPKIKWVIRSVPQEVTEKLLKAALKQHNEEYTRAKLNKVLIDHGLGSLVHSND